MRSLPVVLAFGVALLLVPAYLAAQEAVTPPASTPDTASAPDKVAAVVNGEKIMESELTQFLNRALQGRKISPEQMAKLHQPALDRLIDQRLIRQIVEKKDITIDPKEVDQEIADLKQQIATAGMSFDEMMKAQGLSEAAMRQEVVAGKKIEKLGDSLVTEQDIKNQYEANKAELAEEVRASHVLVKYPEKATDADKKAAKEKIQKIQQEVAKGLDFAAAAKKYSDCPSKAQGGDLNFFPRNGAMVEEFSAAAFALKKGEVSQPVETEFGWHLIKTTDRRSKSLEDLRDQIKAGLVQDALEKLVEQERKTAKIEMPK